LARQKIPGAAVAVLKAGKVVKVSAYGLSDVELNVPVKTDTILRLQSVSKQFTATGVMMLVEEGKISLDEPVSRYVDSCPESWQRITIRHLLNQTSGLKDFINEASNFASKLDLRQEVTDEQLVTILASQPLKFAPGDAWDYSNTNYLLLGMVIGRVSNSWYGDFLAERIFKPLDMTHTSVPRTRQPMKGYTRDKGRIIPSGAVANLATSILSYGGGGIQSTILDMAKWDAALYTEQLLKRSTLQQMWTPAKLNNGTTQGYGFGWEVGKVAQHRQIWHGGNWTGFAAHIDRFVDDQLTVIVLANLAESDLAPISRGVASKFIPALAAPVYKPIADNEPEVTARFLDVLKRTGEGGLRPDEFIEPVWTYIAAHTDQMKRDFATLGVIQKLSLVERKNVGDDRSYRYQARFSRTTMIFHFVLTKDDRISVMMPEEIGK